MGEEVKDAESDAWSEMMLPRGTFVTAQVRLDAMHHVPRTSLVFMIWRKACVIGRIAGRKAFAYSGRKAGA